MILIPEDRVGEGDALAFPKMSSCSAVIAVLGNTLVGAHFTKDVEGTLAKTTQLTQKMLLKIKARVIQHLLIIGFNQNHNPPQIRDHLGIAAHTVAKAYDIGLEQYGAFGGKRATYELCLFVTMGADGEIPAIQFKRDSKVSYEKSEGWFDLWKVKQGYEGTAKAENMHTLRRHFTNL